MGTGSSTRLDELKKVPADTLVMAQADKGEAAVELRGYKGDTQRQGYLRLHPDRSMTSYADVPEDAVLDWEWEDPVAQKGKLKVYVAASREIEEVQMRARRVAARASALAATDRRAALAESWTG
jgi:hypothetical protein